MPPGMRLPIESSFSLRALPPGRAIVLTAMASLLAIADWLPANRYVDPDHAEFTISLALGVSAIVLYLQEHLAPGTLRRVAHRAILAVVTLVVALAAAEPMTRWLFRDVTTSADNRGYFSRRWTRSGAVLLNSWGFRGRDYAVPKPRGAYRIAVVGDSFTYGNGVRQQDRYTELIQARLPEHFEVLNFGDAGANTPQHRAQVRRVLADVQPDFVLLQWYVNDMEDDDTTGRPTFKPLVPMLGLHDWLTERSALYNVANMRWAETQVSMGMVQPYPDYLRQRLGDPHASDAQIDRAVLEDLITSTKRAGVPLGIVLFPDTAGDLGKDYPFAYLHERMLDTCSSHGLTCIDLRGDFSMVKDRRLLWANRLDHHPSALANTIAAEKILATYAAKWAASPSR
jgi:hypothetical protein